MPRPDGSRLPHPPPSLSNCGTAETGEIFRAVGAVLQDQVSPETALAGLNWPHFQFSSLISIFECHVRAKGGSGPLAGPCGRQKEATRGIQNRGRSYRGVAG